MTEYKKMSKTEREVMEVIWNWDEQTDVTMQDIISIFKTKYKRIWKNQTASTFLHRLIEKGLLTSYRSGRIFYYKPLVGELEYRQKLIDQRINKFYGMPLERLIASYCGKKYPTEEELSDIRKKLMELANE